VRSKSVRIRHVVTGVERTVQLDRVTQAPEEEPPGEYDAQYSMVRHLGSRASRMSREEALVRGVFIVARTGVYHSVGQVVGSYADGSAHVEWLNSSNGDAHAQEKWFPAWADSKSALGGPYRMKSGGAKRLWGVVQRGDMVQSFGWEAMTKAATRGVMLPKIIRRYFQNQPSTSEESVRDPNLMYPEKDSELHECTPPILVKSRGEPQLSADLGAAAQPRRGGLRPRMVQFGHLAGTPK
jgi:hypothetical protein